jgi:uncharacterized protein YdeI (BOF family)
MKMIASTSSKLPMKLILVLLFPALAFADHFVALAGKDSTIRDQNGRVTVKTTSSGAKTIFRDDKGRLSGSLEQSKSGKTTFRDAQGRMKVTSNTNGTTTFCRDTRGRILGTASISSAGVTTYRDSSGRMTGTSTLRGNIIIFRDSSGRLTGKATTNK